MRKLLLLLAILLLGYAANAQKRNGLYGWFYISPKVGMGSSYLVNNHLFMSNEISSRLFTFSYFYGLQGGVSIYNSLELAYEYAWLSPSTRYDIALDNLDYTKQYNFQQQSHHFLLRFLTTYNTFELGYGMVENTGYNIQNTINNNTAGIAEITDAVNIFADGYQKLIVGMGFTPLQSGLFEIEVGGRLEYALGDIDNTPVPVMDNAFIHNFQDNKNTGLITAYLQVQFKYYFGFYGKTICGSRGAMFFKKPNSFGFM